MEVNKSKILDIINSSDNIVFFGGAGVSTESGIPDFRSVDGIYNTKWDYPPEEILSKTFFINHPDIFYKFYKEKCLLPMMHSKPNDIHIALANLEKEGKLKALITQNIDDLHHKAGSKNILELHGTSYRNYCTKCKKEYSIEEIMNDKKDVFRCSKCGSIVRPDIVLYEEALDSEVLQKAVKYIYDADCLIIAGTSLKVYPAAGLINYYRGNKSILINKDTLENETGIDYVYHGKAGEIFKEFV